MDFFHRVRNAAQAFLADEPQQQQAEASPPPAKARSPAAASAAHSLHESKASEPSAAVPTAAAASRVSSAAPAAAAASSASAAASSSSSAAAPADSDGAWLPLLRIRECFVYRPPPRVGLTPYQCEAWGLGEPIFVGELHVLANDTHLRLSLCDSKGVLFFNSVSLACLSEPGRTVALETFLEPVRDSSRYFVIKIAHATKGASALPIGIGFRERSSAFDLNAAIQDRLRTVQRHAALELDVSGASSDAALIAAAEARLQSTHVDLALKAGERLHIALPSQLNRSSHAVEAPGGMTVPGSKPRRKHKSRLASAHVSVVGGEGGFRLLPPPDAAAPPAGDYVDSDGEEQFEGVANGEPAQLSHPSQLPVAPTNLSPQHRPHAASASIAVLPLTLDDGAGVEGASRQDGQFAAAPGAVVAEDEPGDDEFSEFASGT